MIQLCRGEGAKVKVFHLRSVYLFKPGAKKKTSKSFSDSIWCEVRISVTYFDLYEEKRASLVNCVKDPFFLRNKKLIN